MSIVGMVLGWLGLASLVAGWAAALWAPYGRLAGAIDRRQVWRAGAGIALLLQAAALALLGASAQRATGSYWSWSQTECWRLVAVLATAILWIGLDRLGREGQRAWVAYAVLTTVVGLALLGAALAP